MNKATLRMLAPVLLAGAAAWAQTQPAGDFPQNPPPPQAAAADFDQPAPPPAPAQPPQGGRGMGAAQVPPAPAGAPPVPHAARPPMERGLPPGRWWNNPEMVQKLNLNSDQQKKMDDIFLQNRLRLVDLTANLQREELTMEPLMSADTLDATKVLAQIDKVAQARAELEKANGRFLVSIRQVLTPDQWKKLQAETPGGRGPGGPGGLGGPGRGPGAAPPQPGRKGGGN